MKLFWLFLSRRPQIVHFFLPEAYLVGAPLAVLARIPVRLMSRRSLNDYQSSWPGARRLERLLHKRMSAVLGNSRRVTRQLIDDEGCDAGQVGLIYNGVDVAQYRNIGGRITTRRALGLDETVFTVIMVANLIPYKGHKDLIDAMAVARGDMPEDWTILCVGEGEKRQRELERQLVRQDLQDHIRFLGGRSDIAELLAAVDLAVLCSHQEGFSNAIIEAMAAGLPLVVSDVGGNSEAVIDGETGIVVPAHDPVRLGAAIARLAAEPELARRYGKAGQERAMREFSIDSCVSRYEQLYEGLVNGKPLSQIGDIAIARETAAGQA